MITSIGLFISGLINIHCVMAEPKTIPVFLSESKETPARMLNPGEMKIKVSKKKRKITMDASYLSEGILFSSIKKAAAEIDHYDEISVPGVEESKTIMTQIFWMHSETMGVHSKDYFYLQEFLNLDGGIADGLNWVPAEKQKDWKDPVDSSFNDFAGYFYIKSLPREISKPPLNYIRYALVFDMHTAVPTFVIKAIVDFKGKALAEGYIDSIIKAATEIEGRKKTL